MKVSSIIMLLGMAVIALWHLGAALLGAAIVYGISMGLTTPATTAWTVDVASQKTRGKALSTTFIAMEAGIGLGALGSGWWYNHAGHRAAPVFWGMAALALAAWIYLWFAPAPPAGDLPAEG